MIFDIIPSNLKVNPSTPTKLIKNNDIKDIRVNLYEN